MLVLPDGSRIRVPAAWTDCFGDSASEKQTPCSDLPIASLWNSPDADVFTFMVPFGHELIGIELLAYEVTAGDNGQGSFFAIANAPAIGTTLPTSGNHLSNMLISETGDLLDDLAAGAFSGETSITAGQPLPAGPYTVFLSEINANIRFKLGFRIRALPQPRLALTGENLLSLKWESHYGTRYEVQFSENLEAAGWRPIGEPIDGTGGPMETEIPLNGLRGLFRLVPSPSGM